MESLAEHIRAFVSPSCFTGLARNRMVPHMSLADLFRLVLNKFDREETLQGEEARHF